MSDRCRKLQEKLKGLPLVPLSRAVRRKRDRIVAQLMASAREDLCVEEVDPLAGICG